ncbi:hypothetical protein D4764_03G0001190 [Takifugu flavidus]|uniref:Uncharacterized protein n=1 Tax=Takifugu flavidus TaxID=433684 RepID=A0A5C6N9N2_9TELE|nr:hypothetical protein D4764_03G0001190 [Takifugu flavidus]
MLTLCTPIYTRKYGKRFVRCFVKQFRPVRLREDATAADIGVVLRNNIPISDLPNNDEVAETLAIAASSNETLSVALSASSIQTILYTYLHKKIWKEICPLLCETIPCTPIYTRKYGTSFVRCFVKQFRPVRLREDATAADIGVVLRNNIPISDLPNNDEVAETLAIAASSNETLSVALSASSIQTISCNYNNHIKFNNNKSIHNFCNYIITNHISNNQSNIKFNNKSIHNFCNYSITNHISKFSPVRLREDATAADIGVVLRNNIPISDLPNNDEVAETLAIAASSNETLSVALSASSIQTISCNYNNHIKFNNNKSIHNFCNYIITNHISNNQSNIKFNNKSIHNFCNYSITNHISKFRNGSVINDMTLGFDNTAVPHHTVIASVLINASSVVTGFDIEGSSISVDGIASSGVNQNMSLFTAFSLVLLSWILSNQQ